VTRARTPAILLAAAAAALGFACDRLPSGPAPANPHLEVRAITVGDWSDHGLASAACRTALDEIAATGADAVLLLVTIRQATPRSNVLAGRTPDFPALHTAVRMAGERGLNAWVKLHVDVLDGSWRGGIAPDDVDTWFGNYTAFVRDCAREASLANAAGLVVGTELCGLVTHEAEWRRVIAEARATFDGPITYAASWDEVERVPFWDALDWIGVDAYYPVAGTSHPSRFDILAGWQPWLARLDATRRRAGRDVFVTEIGYASLDGAGMTPSAWDDDRPVDPDEQADLYWGALTAFADAPWIRGVAWWNWTLHEGGGPDDGGFTPRGKPAAAVLAEAWDGSAAP